MAKNVINKSYSPAEIARARHLNLVIKDIKGTTEQIEKRDKVLHTIWLVLVYAFLVFMSVVVLIPFYWMIITSLKSVNEIRNEITYFPKEIIWENYVVLFKGAEVGTFFENTQVISPFDFWTYLRNTLIVGVLSTAGTIFTTILAAFAFSRLQFKGRDLMFTILLATMMIPGEMMVITNYITVAKLGWLETDVGVFTAMIIPYYAAKVDGKSDWEYLWKVMVPLASPTLITIFILKLMGAWNSYVWPNLVANKENLRLITNGLRGYSPNPDGQPNQALQMAATVIVTTPLLLLFIFFRKYIMRGVGRAGLKG